MPLFVCCVCGMCLDGMCLYAWQVPVWHVPLWHVPFMACAFIAFVEISQQASSILAFATHVCEVIYDLLDGCGLEFRLVQCGAILYERAVVRASLDEELSRADAGLEAVLKTIGMAQ